MASSASSLFFFALGSAFGALGAAFGVCGPAFGALGVLGAGTSASGVGADGAVGFTGAFGVATVLDRFLVGCRRGRALRFGAAVGGPESSVTGGGRGGSRTTSLGVPRVMVPWGPRASRA
jgi:hypothetical protein